VENPDFPLYPIRFENRNELKVTKDVREQQGQKDRAERKRTG